MTPPRQRLAPDERRAQIIDACLEVYGKRPAWLMQCVRDEVALAANCAPALVAYHFGDMDAVRDAVIAEGCRRRMAHLVVLGLALNHAEAMKLTEAEMRAAALEVGNYEPK